MNELKLHLRNKRKVYKDIRNFTKYMDTLKVAVPNIFLEILSVNKRFYPLEEEIFFEKQFVHSEEIREKIRLCYHAKKALMNITNNQAQNPKE